MLKTLIRSFVVALVFGVGTCAQTNQGVRPSEASLNERALQLEPYIVDAAQRYGVDPRLLRVLCFMESRFRVEAVSPKGARGPMQLMPDTALRYGVLNPHDPRQAVEGAARYLTDLLIRFGGRVDLAMAAYNSGEGTVASFLTGRALLLPSGKLINPHRLITDGIPPYRETKEYVRQGINLMFGRQPPPMLFAGRSTTKRTQSFAPPRDFTIDSFVESEMNSGKSQVRMASFIDVP